ncbi:MULTISPECIES: hypothetical protein [Streptomyces]|uniref:Uncharacterized protein n=1 Tax=Streptomyces venezuelae TaxID=54571 RepID=A0A5P2B4T3_STRVZ|nr:hypothetical protein [Streptomyces venezuelae]QES24161.1 hypothetical protein DEJ46_37850 [Streptomyces venezuelae]
MLLEVDRVNEPIDDLVDELRRYTERYELLASKADAAKVKATWGAAVRDLRLWSRIYSASQTARQGFMGVACLTRQAAACTVGMRHRGSAAPICRLVPRPWGVDDPDFQERLARWFSTWW